MNIEIIGPFDRNTLYCTGSLTKLLTTYVSLCFLAETHSIRSILDDNYFLNNICQNPEAKNFLQLFQKHIGSQFSLHDLCSYYTGLPYTFDAYDQELQKADRGEAFKHHRVLDENLFLDLCKNKITPVYANRCKFHYSEISIIFLAYFLEKNFGIPYENLFAKYVFEPFQLTNSHFSRLRLPQTYTTDLSPKYDYPSIAILDHGYFCYSNGFYTTLNDMQKLLSKLLDSSIFAIMSDIQIARAASNRIMNGLAVEIRLADDDVIYGYEGLSFSGCNLWAYSTKRKTGFLTFSDDEETIYQTVYEQQLGYTQFSIVPEHTQTDYQTFLKNYHEKMEHKKIPIDFQGHYHRVRINQSELSDIFQLGPDFMIIRNPNEIKYELIFARGDYRVKGKDGVHGAKVGLYQTQQHHYMCYDGTLYRKIEK